MSVVNGVVERGLRANEWLLDRVRPKGNGPLDTADFPWMAPITARWQEVRAEVDQLEAQRVRLPTTDQVAGFDQGAEGRWTSFILTSYGRWIEANTRRCPLTTSLVRDIPGLQIAGFSVLGPHTHLPRHRGPNRGALRYQVGLKVPGQPGSSRITIGDQTHVWTEGGSMVFDHSVHHEAWNDSDADRSVLFIEFVWPFPGVAGFSNRLTQGIFSQAARGVPRRVEELEQILNR